MRWGPCGSARRNYAMKRTEEHWELRTCRPITDRHIGQVSTKYRRSVGEMSAKCRWMKSYIGRDTSGTTIGRVSTECRPTIDRLSTAISTDCRPSVDRLSTECRPLYRPLYRPISRSTLPTVNKIQHVDLYFKQLLHLIPLKVYVHPLLQSQWKFYRVGDRGQIILSMDCEHSFLQ